MVKVAVAGADDSAKERQASWSQIHGVEVAGHAQSLQELRCLLAEEKVELVEFAGTVEGTWVTHAAQSGVNILLDEHAGMSDQQLVAAADLCEQNGCVMYLTDSLRFSPEYAQAREQVVSGAIGKPGVLRLRRGTHASADGCIFSSLGMREFDWLRWTFGEVERVQANKVAREVATGKLLQYALIILRMRDGAIAQVELSQAESSEHTFFELTGDAGMLLHDSRDSLPIRWSRGGTDRQAVAGQMEQGSHAGIDPLQKQREQLVRHLLGEATAGMTVRDWLLAKEIAQAASESAKAGKPVSLAKGEVAQ